MFLPWLCYYTICYVCTVLHSLTMPSRSAIRTTKRSLLCYTSKSLYRCITLRANAQRELWNRESIGTLFGIEWVQPRILWVFLLDDLCSRDGADLNTIFGRAQIMFFCRMFISYNFFFINYLFFLGKKTCQTAGVPIITSTVGIWAACRQEDNRRAKERESTDWEGGKGAWIKSWMSHIKLRPRFKLL